MNPSVIQCRDVKKSYGNKNILQKVSIDIPRGSVFGLLGENGAGKTTLIKLMVGLLQPGEGVVRVLGEDPRYFSNTVKGKFGYVSQRERLYPWLTAQELINYTASFYRHWNSELVTRLAQSWKIDSNERIGNMSEGESQKVSILLALGHEPELLILDEPVASLDPLARRQFLKMVLELVADREGTVFFSTHITSDLERVADRVALLKDGGVAFDGELEELREKIKRIRILGVQPHVHALNLNGVLDYQQTGQGVIVTVKDFDAATSERLRQTLKAEIFVENLNLEEIFLELNR